MYYRLSHFGLSLVATFFLLNSKAAA